MQFQGEREYPKSPEAIFALLGDARFLVRCIPDSTIVGEPTPDEGRCTVKPDFSFTKGSMELHVRVTDRQSPSALKFVLANKSIGGGADVESSLQLSRTDSGTKVAWQATVQLRGLLKMVPPGLLRAAAQKVLEETWTLIDREVAAVG
jgi:carbon monoxide dehydrogenase subunit G